MNLPECEWDIAHWFSGFTFLLWSPDGLWSLDAPRTSVADILCRVSHPGSHSSEPCFIISVYLYFSAGTCNQYYPYRNHSLANIKVMHDIKAKAVHPQCRHVIDKAQRTMPFGNNVYTYVLLRQKLCHKTLALLNSCWTRPTCVLFASVWRCKATGIIWICFWSVHVALPLRAGQRGGRNIDRNATLYLHTYTEIVRNQTWQFLTKSCCPHDQKAALSRDYFCLYRV